MIILLILQIHVILLESPVEYVSPSGVDPNAVNVGWKQSVRNHAALERGLCPKIHCWKAVYWISFFIFIAFVVGAVVFVVLAILYDDGTASKKDNDQIAPTEIDPKDQETPPENQALLKSGKGKSDGRGSEECVSAAAAALADGIRLRSTTPAPAAGVAVKTFDHQNADGLQLATPAAGIRVKSVIQAHRSHAVNALHPAEPAAGVQAKSVDGDKGSVSAAVAATERQMDQLQAAAAAANEKQMVLEAAAAANEGQE